MVRSAAVGGKVCSRRGCRLATPCTVATAVTVGGLQLYERRLQLYVKRLQPTPEEAATACEQSKAIEARRAADQAAASAASAEGAEARAAEEARAAAAAAAAGKAKAAAAKATAEREAADAVALIQAQRSAESELLRRDAAAVRAEAVITSCTGNALEAVGGARI